MVLSFLFYKVDRKSPLSHFVLFPKWPHFFLHTRYTSPFLLYHVWLLYLSNSMLFYILHTTYYIAASFPGTLVPNSSVSLSPCNRTSYILQVSWLPTLLSNLPCSRPFASQYCFIFSHTLRGGAASSLLFSFSSGHSHFLCPFYPHQKHFTFCSTTSCLLIFFTLHCITRLFNTLNFLPTTIFFFCTSPLLYFQVRCPNLPQCLYNLPSSSALNLARACLSLSMLLMSLLYWSKDIVLCSGQSFECKRKGVCICWGWLVIFFKGLTVRLLGHTILLPARCLLSYWLLP